MDYIWSSTDTKTKIWCGSMSLFSILIIVLLTLSFGAIEPTEYGILYNSISKSIDTDTVYDGGLQWVGLFNKVITYPKLQVSVEFSNNTDAEEKPLNTRTKEGLSLQLLFSFQYVLHKDSLP